MQWSPLEVPFDLPFDYHQNDYTFISALINMTVCRRCLAKSCKTINYFVQSRKNRKILNYFLIKLSDYTMLFLQCLTKKYL